MRLLYLILVLISALYFSWYFFVLLALIGIAIFPNYYEVVGAGLIYDLLYGFAGAGYLANQFVFTISFLLLVTLGEEIKKKLIFQRQ